MKQKQMRRFEFRMTDREWSELERLAERFSRGNKSAYVVSCIFNTDFRRFVQDTDFEFSERRVGPNDPTQLN